MDIFNFYRAVVEHIFKKQSQHHSWRATIRTAIAMSTVIIFGSMGCSLHDPAALKAIEDAKKSYAEYQKSSVEILFRAKETTSESDAFLAGLRRDFAELRLDAVVHALPGMKIVDIKKTIGEEIDNARGTLKRLDEDIGLVKKQSEETRQILEKILLAKKAASRKYKEFEDALCDQGKKVNEVKTKFQEMVDALLKPPTGNIQSKQKDLTKAIDELRKVSTTISRLAEAVASESGTLYLDIFKEAIVALELNEKFGDVFLFKKKDGTRDTEKEEKVKEMVKEFAKQGFKLLELATSQSPGLNLELLRLQADMAQNDVDLAKAHVTRLNATLGNLTKQTELTSQALQYLTGSRDRVGRYPDTRIVLDLLKKWSMDARDDRLRDDARANAQLLVEALGMYLFAKGYFDPGNRQLEVDRSKLDRDFVLERSIIQQRRFNTLVAFGIDGLMAYHREGIRSEDIGNLVRALQTVALGIIAGMID